jgi:hypothetical protein
MGKGPSKTNSTLSDLASPPPPPDDSGVSEEDDDDLQPIGKYETPNGIPIIKWKSATKKTAGICVAACSTHCH